MKLYECPAKTWIKVLEENPMIPIDSSTPDKVVFFSHLDGMYSVCENGDGTMVHLAGWTEVELLEKQTDEDYEYKE